MEFICLLFPACISMNIRCRRARKLKNASAPELVFKWAGWVLAINLLTMGVISYVFGIEGVLAEAFKSFSFFIKYNLIAIIFALVIPYIVEIIEKYIEISVKLGMQDEETI